MRKPGRQEDLPLIDRAHFLPAALRRLFRPRSLDPATGETTYWQRIPGIVGPARHSEFTLIGQQATREALEAWIIAHSGAGTRLLDAGCNTGVEGVRLIERGFRGTYIGIDSNPRALAFALENLAGMPAAFALSDLARTPFPDRYFDIVLSKDVVEHAAGFEPILGELARLARDNVVLSMFIKMSDGPDEIVRHRDGYYLNRYQRSRVAAFMGGLGFGAPHTVFCKHEDEVLSFSRADS